MEDLAVALGDRFFNCPSIHHSLSVTPVLFGCFKSRGWAPNAGIFPYLYFIHKVLTASYDGVARENFNFSKKLAGPIKISEIISEISLQAFQNSHVLSN
jgi:hypothetical protein